MYMIEIQDQFTGAHAVVLPSGEREPSHTHCWQIRLFLTRKELDQHNMVIDFHAVQTLLKEILSPLQGCDLNRNEFTGTGGAMTFPTYGGGIELYRDREKEDVTVDGPPAWQAEWAEFIGAIEEGRDPSINGYWGRRVVEIAQAMYRSSELKRPVELPSPLGL